MRNRNSRKKNGVSVVVCAYNEEKNIGNAIKSVAGAMEKASSQYEIIVVADGCTDGTIKEANKKAEKDRHIKVIDLGRHRGVGYAMRAGINASTREYLSVFPGDNDMDPNSLVDLIRKKESTDLVIGYLGQSYRRGLLRKIASLVYVAFVNKLFNMKIQYFNGPFICKLALVRKLKLISSGFTVFAEMKIKLINNGCTLEEIPFTHMGRVYGKSKAIRISSILDSIIATLYIWWDVKSNQENK